MTTPYIVAVVVILHFVLGIGYLIYKITTARPQIDKNKKENLD